MNPFSNKKKHPLSDLLILPAAGLGERMSSSTVPKAFLSFKGRYLFEWSLEPFLSVSLFSKILILVPRNFPFSYKGLFSNDSRIHFLEGGPTRQQSVHIGLEWAQPYEPTWVWIHDAARVCISTDLIQRLEHAKGKDYGVIPVVPVHDTIKKKEEKGFFTMSRENFYLAQTPQVFPFLSLYEAHSEAVREGWKVSDDAQILEWVGYRIHVIEGDPLNIKVTVPSDLEVVSRILGMKDASWPGI